MTRVISERPAPGVALLTISSPQRRNAMNLALSQQLRSAVAEALDDTAVRALVITGAPPAFCAGGDMAELERADEQVLQGLYAGFLAIAECPLPTIAAVNGPAVGAGLNLALACDVRLAGPSARFDSRFVQLGLHPGGGYTWMAHRAIGPQAATALTLLGEVFDAGEAERVGMVLRSYATDELLLEAAVTMASRLGSVPRELVTAIKGTMRFSTGPVERSEAVAAELVSQAQSISSPHFRETIGRLLHARVGERV